jgi:dihydrofolate reductase
MITLIAACSKNRVIGKDNKLLWYLPNDLKRFKKLTIGKTVVMGRKTFESIGKPLPNRKNIILSNNKDLLIEGCEIINSISDLNLIEDLVIIGGEQIYKLFIDIADIIELTLIDKEFEGDAFFPQIDSNQFVENVNEPMYGDEFNYNYITYKKIINE